jgi:hypothetical protein
MAKPKSTDEEPVATTGAEVNAETGEGLGVDTPATREAAAEGRVTAATFEDALEVGYFGSPPDPRPNEHYAVSGEANRQAMVADGRDPDRPPSQEKVGPTRAEAQAGVRELEAAAEGGK